MKLPRWLRTLLGPRHPPPTRPAFPVHDVLKPTGYPMKVESIDVRMKVRAIKTLRWTGQGREPARRRPWVEWVRENIFQLAPRWRPFTWDEMVREIGWPASLPPPTPVPSRPPSVCTCPLGRPVGLPHLAGCPRGGGPRSGP